MFESLGRSCNSVVRAGLGGEVSRARISDAYPTAGEAAGRWAPCSLREVYLSFPARGADARIDAISEVVRNLKTCDPLHVGPPESAKNGRRSILAAEGGWLVRHQVVSCIRMEMC